MNENDLMKISIFGLLISIVVLYFFTNYSFSIHVKIGDIDRSFIGKTVNITGEITDLYSSKGHLFFDLMDETGEIKIVLWNETLELLDISKINISEVSEGKRINVIGNVQLYKGELEVIPIRGNVKLEASVGR